MKRFQRDKEEPKRAVEYHYLGMYPTKFEASGKYDEYIAQKLHEKEQIESITKKRFVARSCGKHSL